MEGKFHMNISLRLTLRSGCCALRMASERLSTLKFSFPRVSKGEVDARTLWCLLVIEVAAFVTVLMSLVMGFVSRFGLEALVCHNPASSKT